METEQGPSLLEHLTEEDLATTKIIAGVPIYNYHFANPIGGMNPSALELAQAKTWIINFPDSYSDDDIHAFCSGLTGQSSCDYEGHPSEGGIDFAEFVGTEQELENAIKDHPNLTPKFVEPEMPVSTDPAEADEEENAALLEVAGNIPWGLDRIDDYDGTDGSYNLPAGSTQGLGAHVYVADTGVRVSHQDFGGRAVSAIESLTGGAPKECDKNPQDCAVDRHGHGTHCAGTVGGTQYGVAKKTNIYGVKVLSDRGSGGFGGIMKSLDWVMQKGKKPAVWSASLGGPGRSQSAETSFARALQNGVTVSVAAGNSRSDACNFNPAWAPSAITVGASYVTSGRDQRAGFSNFGKCVDIFAPGVGTLSASHRSDTGTATMSGTSMACPHVSGAAAVLLADNPGLSPKGLWTLMQYTAHPNKVSDPKGTPNLMLYTGGSTMPTQGPTTTAPPTTTTLPPTIPPMGSSCNFEQNLCGWQSVKQGTQFEWTRKSGRTSSGSTGPDRAKGGNYYMYIETSYPRQKGHRAILRACGVQMPAQMAFDYHMYGGTMGTLAIMQNGKTMWSKSGNQGNAWKKAVVDLTGTGCVDVVGTRGRSYTGDAAIDNLNIYHHQVTTQQPTQPPQTQPPTQPPYFSTQPPQTQPPPTQPPYFSTQPPTQPPHQKLEQKLNDLDKKVEEIIKLLKNLPTKSPTL
jgi:hypothetical protein